MNKVNIIICENCSHYEETFNNDKNRGGYCYYWDYEVGSSPNLVVHDDFCSNAELNIGKIFDEIQGEIYKEYGAMPINLLEDLERQKPKTYVKIITDFYFHKDLDLLINRVYKCKIFK